MRNGNFRRNVWHKALRKDELPVALRNHDLRHTCASLLIAQGASVKAIQAQLGHASAEATLDRYGHLLPDEMDRLANRLDATREAAVSDLARPIRGLDLDAQMAMEPSAVS